MTTLDRAREARVCSRAGGQVHPGARATPPSGSLGAPPSLAPLPFWGMGGSLCSWSSQTRAGPGPAGAFSEPLHIRSDVTLPFSGRPGAGPPLAPQLLLLADSSVPGLPPSRPLLPCGHGQAPHLSELPLHKMLPGVLVLEFWGQAAPGSCPVQHGFQGGLVEPQPLSLMLVALPLSLP